MIGSTPAERTIHQVRVYRAVGAAKRRQRIPRQVPPRRIEEDYGAAVAPVVARVRASLAHLVAELPAIVAQARRERGDRADADSVRRVRMLIETARQAASVRAQELELLADKYGRRTLAYQRDQLGRQIRAALGVDVHMSDSSVGALLAHFVHANVALIGGVPVRVLADVENAVISGVTRGWSHEKLVAEIDRITGIGERRAARIARDQVQKLFEDVNRARQREIGVTRFRWRTQRDKRVRPHHRVLEGVTFEYEHPPQYRGQEIFPASEPECRCQQEPVFADLVGQL